MGRRRIHTAFILYKTLGYPELGYSMFYKCNALTSLNLSSFNTAKVTTMETMLYECTALTTIYCDDDWARSGINSNVMFSGCT